MAREPSRTVQFQEFGTAGQYDPRNGLRHDEFLYELRGMQGIRKFREMKDNDPIIGAILTAMDMMMRSVEWKFEPKDGTGDNDTEAEEVQFIRECFEDMEGTFSEFISEVLSFLPFGFSLFEVVYKRRQGRKRGLPSLSSKYNDGKIGIRKLAPRAQWTIDRFEVTSSGEILGAYQRATWGTFAEVYLPANKSLLFRTTSINNDPSGRSVLRNAYIPYYYATHIQSLEGIAIERELNGLPVGRVPAKYMSPNANDAEKAFVNAYKDILSKVRRNEVGYILLPSDVYEDENERPSPQRMVDFDLVASKGTRDIDTNKVITRHQHNMARTVLADFIMLGATERGSYALSQDKTNLFLKSISGHLTTIAGVLNNDLIPDLLAVNGYDPANAPIARPGNVAQHDLAVFGQLVERLVGARPGLAQSDEFWTHVFEQTNFPQLSEIPDDPTPPPAPAFGSDAQPPQAGGEGPDSPQEGATDGE